MTLAIAFSKKTGDYAVLSQPDLCVIALTIQLDEEAKSNRAASQVPAETLSEQLSLQQTRDLEKAVAEASLQSDLQPEEVRVL